MSGDRGARIHSMDALRASTMLLLVPVHAATLLALNGHPGAWATAIYWSIHVFRLPLFFARSGFFLALLLSRKGLSSTVRNRTVRIAVPLGLGLVTLVPLMMLFARETGTALTPSHDLSATTPFTFEPSFLWFLWYLLFIDGAAIALYLIAPGLLRAGGERLCALIGRPLGGIPLLAFPTMLALWPDAGWTAAPTTATFMPDWSVLAYYALFFSLGATLCVHRELVAAAARDAWRWGACALLAVLPASLLFSLHNSGSYGSEPIVHGAALLIYAIATWSSLLALIGFADRYLDRPRPVLRYMADSSYWIYLSHMPAMVLIVGTIGATALGTVPQFVLVTAGSLAFSLLTYPVFVRYTVIGRVLNGPRRRTRRRWPFGPRLIPRSAAG
ncbi:MAG: acyltransferase family protein [Solirubrobacterales bacterium]